MKESIKFWERYQRDNPGGELPYGFEWGGQQLIVAVCQLATPYISGKRVLEIGCGGGKWTKAMIDVMGAATVTAFDVHEESIKQSRKYEPRATYFLHHGEGLDQKILIGIDVVFTYDVFLHLPQSLVLKYLSDAMEGNKPMIFALPSIDAPAGREMFFAMVGNKKWRQPFTRGYIEMYNDGFIRSMVEIAGGTVKQIGVLNDRDVMYIATPKK